MKSTLPFLEDAAVLLGAGAYRPRGQPAAPGRGRAAPAAAGHRCRVRRCPVRQPELRPPLGDRGGHRLAGRRAADGGRGGGRQDAGHACWQQRAELSPEGTANSYLLLRDGRQVRWTTAAFYELDGTPRGEIHSFEDAGADTAPEAGGQAGDLFQLTFEKAAVGMTLVSPDWRFLRVNPSFCRMLGYDERALLGMHVLDVTHPDEPCFRGGPLRKASRRAST